MPPLPGWSQLYIPNAQFSGGIGVPNMNNITTVEEEVSSNTITQKICSKKMTNYETTSNNGSSKKYYPNKRASGKKSSFNRRTDRSGSKGNHKKEFSDSRSAKRSSKSKKEQTSKMNAKNFQFNEFHPGEEMFLAAIAQMTNTGIQSTQGMGVMGAGGFKSIRCKDDGEDLTPRSEKSAMCGGFRMHDVNTRNSIGGVGMSPMRSGPASWGLDVGNTNPNNVSLRENFDQTNNNL